MNYQEISTPNTEKRKHPRIETSNEVNYILLNKDGKKVQEGKGQTLNLSQSGLLLKTEKPLYGSYVILMTIDLDGKQVRVKGKVAHSREYEKPGIYFTGIRFMGSKQAHLNAVIAFVKTCQWRKYTFKAVVESDKKVIISCPRCKKTKNLDVLEFKGKSNIRVKCPCGNVWRIQLEFQ